MAAGDLETALECAAAAVKTKYEHLDKLKTDKDLGKLLTHPGFIALFSGAAPPKVTTKTAPKAAAKTVAKTAAKKSAPKPAKPSPAKPKKTAAPKKAAASKAATAKKPAKKKRA